MMRNIKALLGLTVFLIVIHLWHLVSTMVFFDFWQGINSYESSYFGHSEYYIHIGVSVIIFTALLYIALGLRQFIKNSYYNTKSYRYLKWAGFILCVVCLIGIVRLGFNATLMEYPENQLASVFPELLVGIIGYVLITISGILREGVLLKQENDLTI